MILIKTVFLNAKPMMPYGDSNPEALEALGDEIIDALVEVALEEKILNEKLTTRSTEDLEEFEFSEDIMEEKFGEIELAEMANNQL